MVAIHMDQGDDAIGYFLCRDDFSGDYEAALCLLFDPAIHKVGHNIKNIQKTMLTLGVEPVGWVFDTALAAYLLDATAGSYEIRSLCVKYCGFEPWRPESGEDQMSLLDAPAADGAALLGEQLSLAASLACLHEAMEQKLDALGMTKLY